MTKNIEDKKRIISAFEMILSGQNTYYKERLGDAEFVRTITLALAEEKRSLAELLACGV